MSVAIPSLRGAIAVPGWAKNELWRKARAVPSLDLRFAETKSLVDATTGTNLVTFARGGSGTYVGSDGLIKTAATNEPRFTHDPVTGESLGLLVGEQRVNALPWSENFADPSYIPILATIGATNLPAPDGTNTATLLLETGATGEHYIQDTLPPNKTGTVTHSVFVKAAGRNFADLRMVHVGETISTSEVRVDLTTGQITLVNGITPTANVRQFPNGWYRVSITVTLTGANTTYGFRVHTASSSTGNRNYEGDPTKGILIWGAQSEDGAFPTSYIKNTGNPLGATRAADVVSISGSNFSSWYNASEGTVFASYGPFGNAGGVANPGVWAINSSAVDGSNAIDYFNGNSSTGVFRVTSGGGVQAYITANGNVTTTQISKTASAYQINDFARSLNGQTVGTDGSGVLPAVGPTFLNIGSVNAYGVKPLNGPVQRLTFWPQRLPDSTLQAITL